MWGRSKSQNPFPSLPPPPVSSLLRLLNSRTPSLSRSPVPPHASQTRVSYRLRLSPYPSLSNQFRFMESIAVPSQLTVNSPIRRESGRSPGWTLTGFVKLPKYSSKSGHLRTKLCLAHANDGGFRQEMHGVGNRDGVIIVDHGSRRKESNLMLNEFVAMFIEKTGYPIVEPAHMELAEPSIKDAFSTCVQRGAKRVIVSPFFLFPGRHWHQDIPSLTADAAKEHPGVSYVITAPLGLHGLLVDVLNDRIKHCLSHVAGDADECSVCAGTSKCRLNQSP